MNIEPKILTELRKARTSEEKAALVAESILEDLPTLYRDVAYMCGFLFRFTPELINELIKGIDQNENVRRDYVINDAITRIIELPFVEKLSWGYTFHKTTRQGLLERYRQVDPNKIIRAFVKAESYYLENWEVDEAALAAVYGFIITNEGMKAEKYLGLLISRLQSDIRNKSITIFEDLAEAENLILSDDIGLTPAYWIFKTQYFIFNKRLDEGLKSINNAILLDKNDPFAYGLRGQVFALKREFAEALNDANHAIQLEKSSLTYSERSSIYLAMENYKQALFDLTRAINIDPTNPLGYLGRGRIKTLAKKRNAIADFDKALQLIKSNELLKLSTYMERGNANIALGKVNQAISDYNEAINVRPFSGLFLLRANAYSMNHEPTQAIEDYNQILELEPKNSFAFSRKGSELIKLGRLDEALNNLEHAIELNIEESSAYVGLFDVYLELGKEEEATYIFKKAINNVETDDEDFFYGLTRAARGRERYDLALEACKKTIQLNPDSLINHSTSGFFLLLTKNYLEAKEYLERSVDPEKDDQIIEYINLGILHLCLSNSQTSLSYFRKALKNTYGKSKYYLGEQAFLHFLIGEESIGRKKFTIFLKNNPDSDDLYNFRDWIKLIQSDCTKDNFPEGLHELLLSIESYLDRKIK